MVGKNSITLKEKVTPKKTFFVNLIKSRPKLSHLPNFQPLI